MPISITLHAIDRYIDRIDSAASAKSAREHILRAAATAVRSREKTSSGHTYYIADDIRLVVAEERGSLTVVTVLEKYGQGGAEEVPELAVKLAAEFDKAQELLSQSRLDRNRADKEQTARERVTWLEELLKKRNAEIKTLNAKLNARKAISTEQYQALEKRYERQLAHAARMNEGRTEARRIIKAFLVAAVRDEPLPLEIIENEWPGWIDAIKMNA